MTPVEKYSRLLDSLKVVKHGPEGMHGLRFDESLEKLKDETYGQDYYSGYYVLYLIERCRLENANAKSDTLLEEVKEVVRAAMDAQFNADYHLEEAHRRIVREFRRLSEPSQ